MSDFPSPDASGVAAPRMTDNAIVLTGLRKTYPDGWTLGPLDLALPPGRTLALLGPSGCGKSTVLRLLAGLLRADAGRITFFGTALDPATLRRIRLRTGYVVQEGGLFPHLSARDNTALVPRDLGWEESRIAARLGELSALVHLEPALLDRFPAELSGGQRQRVALMRALVLDPALLLLDEPLGALDPMIRVRLQDELGALFRTLGKAVILVTHDLAEAATLADDIVLLRAGQVVQRGTWGDLVERPADDFVREFVAAQSRGART
jgi:osmoprotectant transport system ATP-binding protein